jgi:NADH dehydrogenase/NADH:ubiquinone oxidoreductase subunit G
LSDRINLTIDGKQVSAEAGATILEAGSEIGAEVPTICYHEHTTAYGLCRVCVVEVEGSRLLQPACIAEVQEGMQVLSRSERVERSRRTILEMLDSAVDLTEAPEIKAQMQDYSADSARFGSGSRRETPVVDDNPMFIRDYSQCVLCWRCVQVCADDAQYTYAINFSGRGFETSIDTFFGQSLPESTCVFCGQCIGVCPTGAACILSCGAGQGSHRGGPRRTPLEVCFDSSRSSCQHGVSLLRRRLRPGTAPEG